MDIKSVKVNKDNEQDFIRLYQEFSANQDIYYDPTYIFHKLIFEEKENFGFIVYDDNQPVGMIGVFYNVEVLRYPAKILWGDFLYIKPDYRHTKVIFELFNAIQDLIDDIKPDMLIIDCPPYLQDLYNNYFKTVYKYNRLGVCYDFSQ